MKFSAPLPAFVAILLFSSTVLGQAATVPKLSQLTQSTASPSSSSSSSSSSSGVTITPTDTNTGGSSSQTAPVITGTATATSGGGLTGLPKLAGQYSYPPASVPPTQNAPFMRISSMPEGTVFIAVGAILGAMAALTIAWRGLIAWSLHRSVKRAALQQQLADHKAQFPVVAPMYKYTDRESTISLGVRGKKNNRPSTAGHTAAAASQSLFFSPTAGAAGAGSLSHAGNRGSNYLPAGYYAAGVSAPAGGIGLTTIGDGSRENISLSNLRPQSRGYSQARVSPPESPAAYPLHRTGNMSTSTVDLNPRTTASRAPSAYFEDLLDESSGAPRPASHGGF